MLPSHSADGETEAQRNQAAFEGYTASKQQSQDPNAAVVTITAIIPLSHTEGNSTMHCQFIHSTSKLCKCAECLYNANMFTKCEK